MRLLWADVSKILAMLGVILLHVSAPYVIPFENDYAWWTGNIYDSLSRWSVPLFVTVSGALVIPKAQKETIRKFFSSRVTKILIPFLVWSAVYYLYRIHFKSHDIVFSDFVRALLIEPVYYHLWFIYMLIGLYLLAPAIGIFMSHAPPKVIWYVLVVWFLWASILPIIDTRLNVETYFTPDMNDYSALRLSGYFFLGYMLKDKRIQTPFQWITMLMLFILGAGATIFGTYWLSVYYGEFDSFLYKYFSVTVFSMTISLFMIVVTVFKAPGRLVSPKLLNKIGMSVYGVYLIHALILEFLRDGKLGFTVNHSSAFGVDMTIAVGLPFFAAVIFLFSLVPVIIVRHIPLVRDIVT